MIAEAKRYLRFLVVDFTFYKVKLTKFYYQNDNTIP